MSPPTSPQPTANTTCRHAHVFLCLPAWGHSLSKGLYRPTEGRPEGSQMRSEADNTLRESRMPPSHPLVEQFQHSSQRSHTHLSYWLFHLSYLNIWLWFFSHINYFYSNSQVRFCFYDNSHKGRNHFLWDPDGTICISAEHLSLETYLGLPGRELYGTPTWVLPLPKSLVSLSVPYSFCKRVLQTRSLKTTEMWSFTVWEAGRQKSRSQ